MSQQVSTGSPWEDVVGYSRAVRVGDTVHVAGTTATRDGQVVGVGDAYTQTKVALEIVVAALAEVGATPGDVVRTRIFVTDISQWEAIGRAHGEVFHDVRPASSMIQVAALIDPDLLVEIEADAIVRPQPMTASTEAVSRPRGR
jgi:enamine deaminase RidA (YjgF/YER057c/UK114 family)